MWVLVQINWLLVLVVSLISLLFWVCILMITGGFVDFSIVVVDFILVSVDLEGQRSSVVGGLCFFWG